jgi:hypothetical protein
MTLNEELDHLRAVSRRIEALIEQIGLCECRENVFILEQRARELLSELPAGIARSRLSERVDDAVGERLQELRFQET